VAELTSCGSIALVADLPQAVKALVDAAQLILQLAMLAVQGIVLGVAQVRTDDILVAFCGNGSRKH
jgi:hypothetical protein